MPAKYLDEVLTRAPGAWIQATDPAADNPTWMAVNVLWIDTTATPPTLKKRNATNDGWDTLGKIRTDAEFNTDVRTSRLDQMAAPTANLSINSNKLTNVDDPTDPQDAATKNYVDGIAGGAETGANSDITSMDGLTGALVTPTRVDFAEGAAPGTPGANKVSLYAKADGLLYSKDDAGAETALGGGGSGIAAADPSIQDAERSHAIICPLSGTTRIAVGHTATFSITTPGTGPTSSNDADGIWQAFTTGASNGNEINAQTAFTLFRRDWGGFYSMRIKPVTLGLVRIWAGLVGADVAGTGAPDANIIAMRYSTNLDGTAEWRFYTKEAGVGTAEVTNTGLAVTADEPYIFGFELGASEVKAYHWDGTEWVLLATHSTNLPALTATMGWQWVHKTLEAVDKTGKLSWVRWRHM